MARDYWKRYRLTSMTPKEGKKNTIIIKLFVLFAHITNYYSFNRCTESESKSDRAGRLLGQVKAGITHLSEKLQHIKAVRIYLIKIMYMYY